jgi:hypothetical protein
VVGILANYASGRARVRFTHSADICVYEHVCSYWVWVFLCIICVYLQKKIVYKYVFLRYLESIIQALYVLTLDKIIVSVPKCRIFIYY